MVKNHLQWKMQRKRQTEKYNQEDHSGQTISNQLSTWALRSLIPWTITAFHVLAPNWKLLSLVSCWHNFLCFLFVVVVVVVVVMHQIFSRIFTILLMEDILHYLEYVEHLYNNLWGQTINLNWFAAFVPSTVACQFRHLVVCCSYWSINLLERLFLATQRVWSSHSSLEKVRTTLGMSSLFFWRGGRWLLKWHY